MNIYEDIDIRNFKFWSGGKDRADQLESSDWDVIERELEILYPEGMSDGELNDLFWFDFDMIVQFLGYENEADFDLKRDPYYMDDDDVKAAIPEWWKNHIINLRNVTNMDVLENYLWAADKDLEDLIDECEDISEYYDGPEDIDEPRLIHDYLDALSADEVMDAFFYEYNGADKIDGFPTLEQLRKELMNKERQKHENV